jgi:glycosyltransferase involved in cell wall biosynthesis
VTVIHNGVDAQFFRTGDDDAAASAHALGLPSRRYLLCVGSVEPRKNLVRLIAAWGEILHEMPEDLWLVVAGSGDSRVYQKTGLSTLPPRVFFTGYVPDASLPGLYRGGVGFIYPSIAEGFGLPALEAMASGVPVLTSSTSSLPEVCSTAAIYSDPLSVSDLARSIKLLVSDQELQFKLRFAGRERASQFTWERAANQTLNLLSEFAHSAALPQQAKAA